MLLFSYFLLALNTNLADWIISMYISVPAYLHTTFQRDLPRNELIRARKVSG